MIKHILKLLLVSLLVSSLAACSWFSSAEKPVQAAKQVDLNRYIGNWYEIATIPAFFQSGCICTQTSYSKLDDNELNVTASCHTNSVNNPIKVGTRTADVIHGSNGAKFKIEIFWPFTADYWVLYVDPTYQYSVAGTPDRKYLWILSRTKNISSDEYNFLVKIAKKQAYPVDKLVLTQQICSP